MASGAIKKTTGLTGIKVHPYPRRYLAVLYGKIFRVLQKLPADYPYRQSTEKIITTRADILNNVEDCSVIESKIGCGQIEELILQADKELKLARNLLEWQPWEAPLNKPAPNQWLWPPHK